MPRIGTLAASASGGERCRDQKRRQEQQWPHLFLLADVFTLITLRRREKFRPLGFGG
jgi:hypothetical protein